eukprot:m.486271 g.486271  ORF g.486271 m.486271 type:complete len:139 (-) comp24278_c0_seq1:246-662(-)
MDRLTQTQDLVNKLAGHFRDAVGILHVQAAAGGGEAGEQLAQSVRDFADMIATTSVDIDKFVTSLPDLRVSSEEQQVADILHLEQDGHNASQDLDALIQEAERRLALVHAALRVVATHSHGITTKGEQEATAMETGSE